MFINIIKTKTNGDKNKKIKSKIQKSKKTIF